MVDGQAGNTGDCHREIEYLRRLVAATAARILHVDHQSTEIRHELEQKRRGFQLMAELAVSLGQEVDFESMFGSVSRRLNATINMQRTVVLFPEGGGIFVPKVLQGYAAGMREKLLGRRLAVPKEFLDPLRPAVVTGAQPPTTHGAVRTALELPYFIAAPVFFQNEAVALLVTGRSVEQRPFLPRLGRSDAETVQTVAAYLAAILTGHRLRQAESMAKHDPLTQLPNLRGATEQLHQILAVARRGSFFTATMFVDLDGFKAVNDTYGHAAGDLVLQAVARRLKSCIRESDFVGRIGGDEFVVCLSHIRRPTDAGLVAANILKALEEPIAVGDAACRVGASIGIAIFPDNGSRETDLVNAADEAMYGVKRRGKNGFAFATAKGKRTR
ncbi:MAG: sensor domain-containing diguanylate cyclase [Planctomycetes bacterium]|nr:sensor domain-containing diguanylate cyclase [Planctomycetota bacterium]